MIFSSLRLRLWLTYALLVGVVLCMLGTALVVYLIRNPFEVRQQYQVLGLTANLLVPLIQRNPNLTDSPSPEFLQTAVDRAGQALNIRVAVYNPGGQLLADSHTGGAESLPNLVLPNQRKPDSPLRLRNLDGRIWLYILHPLENGNLLMAAAPYPRLRLAAVLRNDFFPPFVQAAIAALLIALLLAAGITRWVTAPLQHMSRAAQKVSAASTAAEIQVLPLEGPNEVRTLAAAFNEMIGRVQSSQQSQRDFLANISHELKTPLTSIQGFAQAILDGAVDTPESLKQAAGVIYDESGRIYQLVLELLDLARLDSGLARMQRAPVDLEQLLHGLARKFEPQARQAQVNLTEQIDALPAFTGDGDRLGQVFSNLVDNAIKYTPPGGQVHISAGLAQGYVEVSVADSGPGIPEDQLGRIFERFYQVDKSRQGGSRRGVGLGLAIAREIVQAHSGTISAQNQNRAGQNSSVQGCIFVVKLPVARPDAPTTRRKTERG